MQCAFRGLKAEADAYKEVKDGKVGGQNEFLDMARKQGIKIEEVHGAGPG